MSRNQYSEGLEEQDWGSLSLDEYGRGVINFSKSMIELAVGDSVSGSSDLLQRKRVREDGVIELEVKDKDES